jgi:hypothetical protein
VCQRLNDAPAHKTVSPRAVAQGCSRDSVVDESKISQPKIRMEHGRSVFEVVTRAARE